MPSTTPPPFSYPALPQRGDSLRLLVLLPYEKPQQPTKKEIKNSRSEKREDDDDDNNDNNDDNNDNDSYNNHDDDDDDDDNDNDSYNNHDDNDDDDNDNDSYNNNDDNNNDENDNNSFNNDSYNDQDEDAYDNDKLDELDGDDTHEPITCELIPRAFASKPIYECLSYTWGNEPANRCITLNGQPFLVRKNLFCALRYMRRDKPRELWIDAICINQNDIPERNYQVSIMSFVYTRASRVLVWLGVPPERYQPVDKELNIIRSEDNAKAMAEHPYWSRLWIIQEIALAQDIIFMHGSFEIELKFFTHKLDSQYNTLSKLAIPLLENKDKGDLDEYRLETLIDKFQNAQCVEKRDKIFGFLGLANDVDEEIEAEYEVGIFDLYKKLLDFHQAGQPLYGGHFGSDIRDEVDRAVQLMKFSSLLQKVFEGRIEEEAKAYRNQSQDEGKFYYARGALAGEILYLGPTYLDTVSSHRANKRWKIDIGKIYSTKPAADVRELRENDKEYSNLLLKWDDSYLNRIRNVHSTTSYGYRWSPDSEDILPTRMTGLDIEESKNLEDGAGDEGEPRRFLATDSRIGFAPPGARVGDFVYHFLDCDVAVILRRTADELNDRWQIIGKADLCQRGLGENAQKISKAGLNFDHGNFLGIEDALGDWNFKDTMNLKMDTDVLQRLS